MTEKWKKTVPEAFWTNLAMLIGLLVPLLVASFACSWGFSVRPLVLGLLRRHAGLATTFILLIAVSVAISVALLAQERALREGSARAADKFDVIIAAPGSEFSVMLATVYLEPTVLPLIDGPTYSAIENHELVELAAPLAFGDSWNGRPVVGTTAEFVERLSGGLAEGRVFSAMEHAVAGANVPVAIGDVVVPVHGDGSAGALDVHGFEYTVVGTMQHTGSPWDNAILVAVEAIWDIHAMPIGHGEDWDGTLGGPFDPSQFAGTPAAIVSADALWANFTIQSEFNTGETMAFFPGEVLTRLHRIMGDIRKVMSALALASQTLVAVSVLVGLSMLSHILAKRLALLQAMGAPQRFGCAVLWSFSTLLICVGAGLGIVFGLAATTGLSQLIASITEIEMRARLAWAELHLAAGFTSGFALIALLVAIHASRRPVLDELRR